MEREVEVKATHKTTFELRAAGQQRIFCFWGCKRTEEWAEMGREYAGQPKFEVIFFPYLVLFFLHFRCSGAFQARDTFEWGGRGQHPFPASPNFEPLSRIQGSMEGVIG